MINAKELRVGNFIGDNKNIYRVESIVETSTEDVYQVSFSRTDALTGLRYSISSEKITPILLTPEILERNCSFEVVQTERRNSVVALFGDYQKGDFVLNSGHDEFWYWSAPMNTKIKYLHHLQNLYFDLVGEELNIQLNDKKIPQP